jgi:organic radical activating enzyme
MTTFIRTLGCDMKCTGCDTFYGEATPKTVGNSPYEKRTTQSLLDEIESNGGTTVCLTGGEPTLYYEKQVGIAAILRGRGYWITMQTNGKRLDDILCGLIQSVNLDIKPPSSFQPVRTDKIKHLWPGQQVKVLVGTPEDLEFALQVDAQLVAENPDVNLVLQPYIYGHEHNAKGVIQGYKALYDVFEANVKRFSSNVRMTIQSHKLIAAR